MSDPIGDLLDMVGHQDAGRGTGILEEAGQGADEGLAACQVNPASGLVQKQ